MNEGKLIGLTALTVFLAGCGGASGGATAATPPDVPSVPSTPTPPAQPPVPSTPAPPAQPPVPSTPTPPALAQTVTLTFDDGPYISATPLLSPEQRNQAILDALARHKVKSVLFVTAANGSIKPQGLALARAWGDAGHLVGNHTMSHPDLDVVQVSLQMYQQEILDCDTIIKSLPGYRKWFRFTFLHEGNTPAKREGMHSFLKQQGYRNAPVSFNVADWDVDGKLLAALNANPNADITPIKQAYLDDVRRNAQASLGPGTPPKDDVRVMLLHHNLANALWLDELIGVLEAQGWKIAPAEEVFNKL